MISTKHLQVLAAVIRQGSVTGAAAELNMSQPTASKALKRLEDIAGMRLFERLEGRLRPTAEAVILAQEADRLNDQLTAFQRLVENFRHHAGGHLRILTAPAFAASIVPRAIMAMSSSYPDVRFLTDVETQPRIMEAAAWGRIDIGVVHYPDIEPMATTVPIGKGRIVCIMPQGHELAAKTVIHAKDLVDQPMVAYRSDLPFARSIREHFFNDAMPPEIRIEANHTSLVGDLVRLGAGIALVDDFTLRFEPHESLEVRPIFPEIEVTLAIVHARNRPLSRPARAFHGCLADILSSTV